ncbi:long-chain-fatty-acid--CoA ligase [Sandaracinobacter sp. RS1-74]|uniref:long-chain-fatty-acid--CoA ligase n=1 Tax=Sandaracinobacteroides sayramensis TaxID=2913411 RepID=UPI001EDC5E36|nr:long-chain-fatty-acid--CoA ligase [Sandaracinobacteroides sayramensis]MCG2840537.1 long-chain-fatty-acid--CoA ligase [Sandaracinobacteroides sayramensis]
MNLPRIASQPRWITLPDMAMEQAERLGEKPALDFRDRRISYAGLARNMWRIFHALRSAGCAPGSRVAWFGKNRDVYYELLLGAAAAGVVVVPVNWRLADPEVEWILRDSECRIIFATAEFVERIAALALRLPSDVTVIGVDAAEGLAYSDWRDRQPSTPVTGTTDPDSAVVQLYTSGTTGHPKGALLSQRALLVFRSIPAAQQPEWNRWSDDDVSLIVMPQFHIGGTGFGLQTLCSGATGLVEEEFDAGAVLEAIASRGLSKFFTVPSAIQMLLQHPRVRQIDYSRMRAIVYGASPIPLELLREAMDVFRTDFVQQYGMTEMCGTIAVLGPEAHDAAGNPRMLSAGRALPGVEIAIQAPDGESLPAGVTGEVVIRSPTCMLGYWKMPEATAAALDPEGWFHTGDAGYLDEEGYLFLRDRLKDMIVSGGENVFPAEVENAIFSHPAVREVAVIGVPDARWGETVKAVVALHPGAQADAEEIRTWARERIAGFKVPKSVDFIASLPRNASGKILRRELRQPYWAGHDRAIN